MAKVLYHATMSLDGFIAGPGGEMTWIMDYLGGPNAAAADLLANIGALLIGARTHHGGESDRGSSTEPGKPYGGAWTGPMFVLTHDPDEVAPPGFTLLDGDIPSAVATAKAAAGDKCVVVFGAATAARCLEAGLLDEILVHVAPVLLGDGVRMFSRPGGAKVRLERIRGDVAPPIVDQWLRVVTP
ncbi:MAG TPA: dihydrofolate reductase family protein [Actinocrinis sp.]|nr:dihydrofolate reductase family protein [Actinocrinis sp.]